MTYLLEVLNMEKLPNETGAFMIGRLMIRIMSVSDSKSSRPDNIPAEAWKTDTLTEYLLSVLINVKCRIKCLE